MTDRLLPYYNEELQYLRRIGAEFAQEHPKIAARLRLGDDLSEDPHVSRIIEAFALLAARTRLKLDDDFPGDHARPAGRVLYPHYLAPIPSTSVVEFSLDRQAKRISSAGTRSKPVRDDRNRSNRRRSLSVPNGLSGAALFPFEVAVAASYKGQPFQSPPSPLLPKAESAIASPFAKLSRECRRVRNDRTIDSHAFFYSWDLPRGDGSVYELVHNDAIEVLLARIGPTIPTRFGFLGENRSVRWDLKNDECIFPAATQNV